MPTYEYSCSSCQENFEIFHGMKDPTPAQCPGCGAEGSLKKLLSAGSGLIFKGTGFYITDYKKDGSSASAAKEEKSESKPEVKKESPAKAKTDDKPSKSSDTPAKKD